MAKGQDVYMEPQVMTFPGMTVIVYRPVLTEEERAKRMKAVEKASAQLLRDGMKNRNV